MIAWLVQNAVVVVPLAVGIALICRVFRPAPAVCHALWLLVLLKLVMPPLPVWKSEWLEAWFAAHRSPASSTPGHDTAAAPPSNATSHSRSGITARVAKVIVVQAPDVAVDDAQQVATAPVTENLDKALSQTPQPTVNDRGDFAIEALAAPGFARHWMLLLWALGAAVAIVRHTRRILRIRRVMNSSVAAVDSLAQDVAVQCRKLRVPLPRTRVCLGLPGPMVIALPRATLLWPAGLEDRLDEPGRRAVLLHELAHLKRRDHLTALLEDAVGFQWRWHPVVWWARSELRYYSEMA